MTETKFTPGPWAYYAGFIVTKALAGGVPIPVAHVVPTTGGPEACAANVALMAAAPDLYAALDGLLEHYRQLVNCGDCGNSDPEEEDDVKAAASALAKARGEG